MSSVTTGSEFIRHGEHYVSAVCRRGHVANSMVRVGHAPINAKCETCGASVLRKCPECERPLRGNPVGVVALYEPPEFCYHCASPLPWASRSAVAYHIENQLIEQEDLTEGRS